MKADQASIIQTSIAKCVHSSSSTLHESSVRSRDPSFLWRCSQGVYKGKIAFLSTDSQGHVIGSSSANSHVSFCIRSPVVDEVHAKVTFDREACGYVFTNLSQGSTTWTRISLDECLYEVTTNEKGELSLALNEVSFGADGAVLVPESTANVWMDMKAGESRRLLPNDQVRFGSGSEAIVFEVLRFNSGVAATQGIRPSMEDEEEVVDDLGVSGGGNLSWYGCYDGHGSFEGSKFVKNHLRKNFLKKFIPSREIVSSLLSAFEETDSEFTAFVRQTGLSQNVGSVVNVVLIANSEIFCANLGDSRALLGRADGSVVELSVDQKPLVEESRIRSCGGTVSNGRVNGRLAVSRAIGDLEFKVNLVNPSGDTIVSAIPEIRRHSISDLDEFVVIACDGLFDVMSSGQVAEFVGNRIKSFLKKGEEPDPKQIAIDLITESVMKRNTHDNVTIIVVLLKQFISSPT